MPKNMAPLLDEATRDVSGEWIGLVVWRIDNTFHDGDETRASLFHYITYGIGYWHLRCVSPLLSITRYATSMTRHVVIR